MTTKELAKAMEVSAATIYYWEKGYNAVKARHLIRLASIFDCSYGALLS
jgi:transcriptional regulator with XRE-family HTH domain